MSAKIYRFLPPKGYSLWGSVDMDGVPLWYVDLADSDGIVHEEWMFLSYAEARAFLAYKRGRLHA